MTVAGAVAVSAPRVNDRRVDDNGERMRFRSSILPPYARRSPAVTEVLPLLYLHGLPPMARRQRPGRSRLMSPAGRRNPELMRSLCGPFTMSLASVMSVRRRPGSAVSP